MKKALLMVLAACTVVSFTAVAAADSQDPSDFTINGSIQFRYRADTNSNGHNFFFTVPDGTNDGLRTAVILNMNQKLNDNLDLYARFSYVNAPYILRSTYGADLSSFNSYPPYNGAVDQYGLDYKNAGWSYKLGAQPLSLGATGLLYDDNRYFGRNIFNNAVNATGKIGEMAVNAVAAQSNYQSGYANDNIYYVHGSIPVAKSTFGFGYARANYGSYTASHEVEDNATGLDYYTADFSYNLPNSTFFHSEFIKSSAADNNNGVNLVLFHIMDPKNNGGIAWFRVEGQAAIQQATQGNMTYQWGNAQGYGVFYNHNIDKNTTFSFTDFKMKKIADLSAGNPSGMATDQNTLRVDLTYKF